MFLPLKCIYRKNSYKALFILLFFGVAFLMAACKKEKYKLSNNIGSVANYNGKELYEGVIHGSVYYSGSFNAFTDIAYFDGRWVLVFREGTDHMGVTYGRIKIVTSYNGIEWKVENAMSIDSVDLRDPKLMVDSATNHLYITFFGRSDKSPRTVKIRNYFVNYTGAATDKIEEIVESWPANNEYVLWRWTAWKQRAYSIAYRLSAYHDSTTNLCLMESERSFSKRAIIKRLNLKWQPTESTVRFSEEAKMYVAVRADAASFYIGVSNPPYSEFRWLSNNGLPKLTAPNFMLYKNYLLITGRDLSNNKFRLFVYNLTQQKVEREMDFPGGYEVGYAGMAFNPGQKNELWISYYSIENGGHGSNIYLIKMDLEKVFK